MIREHHTINASGKPLGRLAVEVANLLRGKHKPTYVPYKDEGCVVIIENIKQMKITGKKMTQKLYVHHTGWPGGFRQKTMQELVAQKGLEEVLRLAVFGMMSKNKLRAKQIKRLKFLYRNFNKYNKDSDTKKGGRGKLVFPEAERLKPQGFKEHDSRACLPTGRRSE